jgi:hypothetical protein
VSKIVQDRDQMYNALFYGGQLHLMERSQCTLHFMTEILQKKKHALKKDRILPYDVDSRYDKILTVKRLVAICEADPVLKLYLPKDAVKHVSKQWLVDLMHSLDSSIFDRLIEQIESKLGELKPKAVEKVFDIDPDMLDLLTQYAKGKQVKPNARSMARMLKEPKKRTRKD